MKLKLSLDDYQTSYFFPKEHFEQIDMVTLSRKLRWFHLKIGHPQLSWIKQPAGSGFVLSIFMGIAKP